ncbi:MAG: VWA domain-containing protein [Ignavibacteriota bacterium]|nr:VWA domain-containing protein [Ignavibacteriota bacterium]MCC7092739.1 BatA and WFA domain-containing protein [Ignavibacteriaceae bacterium]MEB2296668.1 BatA and WFA domain-containing protein [Ignavibacteria bacterium]QKJ95260.1 MAG: VWA domain-containing protein [Ignavibacteriota bacterium]GIK59667.1 MAG: membrane protein [Ignavibacteriota bacterium]
MTFLNPAVLFGLLAASIPIIIHLLNLRKLKKIDFSTLQFLKELQKNKIRKIKIKQWLLLALRVLIILAIVTAFARPTIVGVSIGGTTSAAKTTAVFILDDTFSMSVVDQNGSYFNQAKEAIKNILTQFEEGDEFGLVLVSHQPDEIEMTSNLNKFVQEVDATNISYASGKLNNSIIKAAELIGEAKNFNKEIYVLADFQKGRLANEDEIIDLKEQLGEQVRLYTFNYSGKEVFNFGIDDLKLNTQIFEKDKPVKFEATLKNYSERTKDNLVVSLFINGERLAQQSINLNSGESKIANLEASARNFGYNDAIIEIEEDDIIQDNKRYTSFFISEKIPVLILADDVNDTKLIEAALKSVSEKGYFDITIKKTEQISGVSLNNFQVIILLSDNFGNESVKLNQFLSSGKGIIIFPPSENGSSGFNSSLNSIGITSAGSFVKLEAGQSIHFSETDFNHPLFENIFMDEKKKQIESPEIFSYFKINPGGKGKSIIKLQDESSFLSEYSIGDGKVLLFSSSPVFSWSDFPIKGIFAPLVTKSVMYLSAYNKNEVNYFAGETINVNVAERTLPQIKIVRPDKSEDFINIDENQTSDFISYAATSLAGNYEFLSGEKLLASANVNTDPAESVTEYLTESDFDEYLEKINFNGKHIIIDKNENPTQMILQARFGSELWRYFVLIAILLALVEMTIARNAKKELVELKDSV